MSINVIKQKAFMFSVLGILCLSLTACGTGRGERALTGGAIGAGVGAVGSGVTGGSPMTGAVVGGATGAGIGALTSPRHIDLNRW